MGWRCVCQLQTYQLWILSLNLKKRSTVEEVNGAFKAAAEGELKDILVYSELPLVSCDYNGSPASSTIDALSTMVMEGNLVKYFLV